jgi:hypothetical protein
MTMRHDSGLAGYVEFIGVSKKQVAESVHIQFFAILLDDYQNLVGSRRLSEPDTVH